MNNQRWETWLRQHAGQKVAARTPANQTHPPLEDAPGGYVLIP